MPPSDQEAGSSLDLGGPSLEEFTRTQSDLERWRAGDRGGFEDLWSRSRPALEVLIAGKIHASLDPALRAKIEVEDVVQEVALIMLDKVAAFEYRGPGSVLAWMGGIARNVVRDRVDYWKSLRRNPNRHVRIPDTSRGDPLRPSSLRSPGPGPSTAVDLRDRRRRVGEALATLDERSQTIIMWRFFAGASWVEIAAEVDASSADALRMECHGKILPALAAALAIQE